MIKIKCILGRETPSGFPNKIIIGEAKESTISFTQPKTKLRNIAEIRFVENTETSDYKPFVLRYGEDTFKRNPHREPASILTSIALHKIYSRINKESVPRMHYYAGSKNNAAFPTLLVDTVEDSISLAEYIHKSSIPKVIEAIAEIQKLGILDIMLGNEDVIGMDLDNIRVIIPEEKNKKPLFIRIDVYSGLGYNGKGTTAFIEKPYGEIEELSVLFERMRNVKRHAQHFFGKEITVCNIAKLHSQSLKLLGTALILNSINHETAQHMIKEINKHKLPSMIHQLYKDLHQKTSENATLNEELEIFITKKDALDKNIKNLNEIFLEELDKIQCLKIEYCARTLKEITSIMLYNKQYGYSSNKILMLRDYFKNNPLQNEDGSLHHFSNEAVH
ncbi:MAG: hypothetical protein ACTSXQ_06585 [Alphaproteobacteria bacterium]